MERNVNYLATMVEAVQVRVGWAQVELLVADTQEVQTAVAGDERSAKELIIRHENGKLVIEQPQYGLLPHLDSKWLQICVRVPQGWKGNVALTTVSGAISAKGVRGAEVSLDTVSGTVHVDRVQCETLAMNAVSGAVQATRVLGRALRVRNVSASIGLFEATFDAVKVVAVSGHVNMAFVRPFVTLELQAATGDMQLSLPGDRLETVFRSVGGKLSAEGFTGGDGAPTLQATTVTGNVHVTRAEEVKQEA